MPAIRSTDHLGQQSSAWGNTEDSKRSRRARRVKVSASHPPSPAPSVRQPMSVPVNEQTPGHQDAEAQSSAAATPLQQTVTLAQDTARLAVQSASLAIQTATMTVQSAACALQAASQAQQTVMAAPNEGANFKQNRSPTIRTYSWGTVSSPTGRLKTKQSTAHRKAVFVAAVLRQYWADRVAAHCQVLGSGMGFAPRFYQETVLVLGAKSQEIKWDLELQRLRAFAG